MDKESARLEVERLLRALGEPGRSSAVRSLCEKRLSRMLRVLGPNRVLWRWGEPVVVALAAPARRTARAADSMFGARRAAGYERRVG